MNLAKLLRRPATEHPHRIGHPGSHTVADIVARLAQEPTQVIRLPRPRAERATRLLRFGDPKTVFEILGGRNLCERPAPNFRPGMCQGLCEPAQQATVLISGDNEHLEVCADPACYHEALRWINDHDETSDTDIHVEYAVTHTIEVLEP